VASPAARRGVIAFVTGIVLLSWPARTSLVIITLVGLAGTLVGGSDLFTALRRRQGRSEIVRSLLILAAGLTLLAIRTGPIRWLAWAIAALLAARGIVDLVSALRQWSQNESWEWAAIRGTAQVLLAALTAINPRGTALLVAAALAGAWIVTGLINVVHAFNRAADGEESADEIQAIATLDTPHAVVDWLRERDMGGPQRQAVIEKLIFEGPAFTTRVTRFVVLILFSTAIATFGLEADSTAVVIGAMLIAPLMTPIMATAASLLMGWPVRALRSTALVALGVALAIGTAWILSKYTPALVQIEANGQVLSRVSPTLLDLMVALAAGGAGAYAVSRPDVSDSLPGVAIAVALVPPLGVVGISLEAGRFDFAGGAFLLFLTNLVGIIFAAGVIFVLVGFSPWFHLEANRGQINRSFAVVTISLFVIAIPLTVTGGRIVAGLTNQSQAENVVDDWLGPESDYVPARVIVDGSSIDVAVVGSGPPPSAEELADSLAVELDTDIELDLRVIPQERTTVTASP